MNHLEATLGTIMSKHMDKTTALRSLNADDVEVVVAMVQECSQATHTATVEEVVRIVETLEIKGDAPALVKDTLNDWILPEIKRNLIAAITTNQVKP